VAGSKEALPQGRLQRTRECRLRHVGRHNWVQSVLGCGKAPLVAEPSILYVTAYQLMVAQGSLANLGRGVRCTRSYVIHPSAWKVDSRTSASKILHSPGPVPVTTKARAPPSGRPSRRSERDDQATRRTQADGFSRSFRRSTPHSSSSVSLWNSRRLRAHAARN
jgi:hypothetical protein